MLLVIHGIVTSLWFLLLPVQGYLAETRRLRWHRPLGWAGVLVAVLIVVTSPAVIVRSVPNGLAAGLPGFVVSFIFMTDMLRVAFFAAMVAVAIWCRRRRVVHTRALFMASLSHFAPATSRLATMVGWNAGFSAAATGICSPRRHVVDAHLVGFSGMAGAPTNGRGSSLARHWVCTFVPYRTQMIRSEASHGPPCAGLS